MSRRLIHSVGIDIGTTTTQVIFSQLELVNRAPASQVPHYEFTRREIIYVSPVVFTPLDANGNVNQAELMRFIQGQYQAAGLDVTTVESGAIIITGETSKAKNARLTIMELAKTLGDFVVATAGQASGIHHRGARLRRIRLLERTRLSRVEHRHRWRYIELRGI